MRCIARWLLLMGAATPLQGVNFYIGGNVGIGEIEESLQVFSIAEERFVRTPFRGSSFLGGVVVGVEHDFCSFLYSALELNGRYNDYRKRVPVQLSNTEQTIVDLKNRWLYGADLKIGIPLTLCRQGTIPYALAGIEAGPWRKKIGGHEFLKTMTASKLGGGVRFSTSFVDVDLQYSFAWFGKFKESSITLQSVLLTLNYPFL